MMKRTRTYSLLAGSLVALALISGKARAADSAETEWGDLGYSHPDVEPMPTTLADAPDPKPKPAQNDNDEIATTISSAELMDSAPKNTRSATDINTVQNTYGVQTEETHTVSFYAAPFAGVTSMLGNDSVDSSPRYSAGVSVGALIMNNLLVQATFVHSESNLSNPTQNSTGILLLDNAMLLSQNSFGGGGRFFILGRESRVRPFVGGGANYVHSSLNYNDAYATTLGAQSTTYSNDLTLNQFNGYGEVGAEVAITRNIVATANFQVSGVLSSSISSDTTVDATRLDVANSVGRTASYAAGAGLGIYF